MSLYTFHVLVGLVESSRVGGVIVSLHGQQGSGMWLLSK